MLPQESLKEKNNTLLIIVIVILLLFSVYTIQTKDNVSSLFIALVLVVTVAVITVLFLE